MASAEAGPGPGPGQGDLEAQAEQLIAATRTPRRRVRPRLAEPLQGADDHEVATPFGPVMAWRTGEGTATLLVHGWEDDNALWGPLIYRFHAIGRPVVTLDLPGHGFSRAEVSSPESAGEAIKAVAAALGPIDSLVGHSFGCIAAVWAMDHGLSIDRAVLIASPLGRPTDGWVERQIGRGADPVVANRAMEIMAERRAADENFSAEKAAARMTAKALVVHSMDDPQAPVSNAYALADSWPGAELMLADDLGHRLIAQDPDTLTRIADFADGFG